MGKVHEGANRATPSEAATYVEEIDRYEQDRENRLDQLNADFKKKVRELNKSIKSDIDAILEDAKKHGVTKEVVRTLVSGQKRIRKHSEALATAKEKAVDGVETLEAEQHDYAVDILTALGSDFAGFGLGSAAVVKEKIDAHKDKQPDPAAMATAMAKDEAAKKADKTSATVTSIKEAASKPH